jgi:predicted amidohydrolase
MMHILKLGAIGLVLAAVSTARSAELPKAGKMTRVCAVCQSWEPKDRNLPHVLEMLDQAAAERADVVCLPEECVPTDGGPSARAALAAISKAAAARSMIVAANLKEKDGDKLYSTSYLIGPDGKLIGKYRKSHRLPYEPIALGSALPVFDTPCGKIGLMIGSDHYWFEVPLVLALQGADLILWSHGPEPVPQDCPLDITMRIRAFDNHLTLAVANYAGELPYLCSNWPEYTGQPLGRGCVLDRSGIAVADTGLKAGVAVAPLDLGRGNDVYHLTFTESRSLFHYLVDPKLKPLVHRGQKRKIRVSIAQVLWEHTPNPNPNGPFLKAIDEAGHRGSDVILMAEFSYPTDTPEAAKTFAQVAERAKKYHSYIIIGGLYDPAMTYTASQTYRKGQRASWAYLWDRTGKVVAKYRISQYGGSKELPVFKTDFGVIGLMLCGDIYSPEISRAMVLQGAEILLDGAQSWGASGQFNLRMQQARALDNAVYMVAAHFPRSDVGQRSYVIDPYGYPVAASDYWRDSVCSADIDLDAGRVWFAPSAKPGTAGRPGYLAGYYPATIPEKRTDFRSVLFAGRRPELYRPIVEKTLADRDFSPETKRKMKEPR